MIGRQAGSVPVLVTGHEIGVAIGTQVGGTPTNPYGQVGGGVAGKQAGQTPVVPVGQVGIVGNCAAAEDSVALTRMQKLTSATLRDVKVPTTLTTICR